MKNVKYAIMCLAIFALYSCESSIFGGTNPGDFFDDADPVEISSIKQGNGSYDVKQQNLVIRNSSKFKTFWKKLYGDQKPLPDPPEIDFNSEMVVISVMGTQKSGGYTTEISQAGFHDGKLGIEVKQRKPGEGCITTTSLINPYHIVKLDQTDRSVEFFEVETKYDCSGSE